MTDATAANPLTALCGAKHVALLDQHLRQLHQAYPHGNRTLFYDQVLVAHLLAFFNPALRSLRTIEDFSVDPSRQMRRLCRSTLSDAHQLMDPKLLEPIIADLQRRVGDLPRRDGPLHRLLEQVQLVDGSLFNSCANVAWALRQRGGKAKARLDLRLDGSTLLPVRLSVGGHAQSEAQAASLLIDSGVIYVADRGFENLAYVNALLAGNADFVLRTRSTLKIDVREELPLDAGDVEAGVLSDRVVQWTGSPHAKAAGTVVKQQLRQVVVFDPAHPDKPLCLITSLLDVPAHVIAQLYRHRWQIELFFRWLKVHAHFGHLISRSQSGMTLGFHVAVIAVLLMYLRTGRPMSKYGYIMLGWVASGQTTLENIWPILERREKECQRERQRRNAKRAAQTHA